LKIIKKIIGNISITGCGWYSHSALVTGARIVYRQMTEQAKPPTRGRLLLWNTAWLAVRSAVDLAGGMSIPIPQLLH